MNLTTARSNSSISVRIQKLSEKDGMAGVRVSGSLAGRLTVPSSKSAAHRVLICSALADRQTTVRCVGAGDDIHATAGCLRALGVRLKENGDSFSLTPLRIMPHVEGRPLMDCGESGSTLRFMLPVTAALGISSTFIGRGRLPERPLSPLYEQMTLHGVSMSQNGIMPLTVDGRLKGGDFTLDAGVSSQFVSGLLMAFPLTGSDCRLELTGKKESTPYIDLTVSVMRRFGVSVEDYGNGYRVAEGQRYVSPGESFVEGDWSGAAFWLAAACAGSGVIECYGLDYFDSVQGDRIIVDILREMGGRVEVDGMSVIAYPSDLHGVEVDCSNIPDLVPALAVAASCSSGETVLKGVGRLRLKESDRIESVCAMLSSFGIRNIGSDDSIRIWGGRPVCGTVNSEGDHRIAMAAAVIASLAQGVTVIDNPECSAKSYPGFFDSFRMLGGTVIP